MTPSNRQFFPVVPPRNSYVGATMNPAGIQFFYRGERPPWDYPTMIMAQEDLLRVAEYTQDDAQWGQPELLPADEPA